jgi:hypothetical protein
VVCASFVTLLSLLCPVLLTSFAGQQLEADYFDGKTNYKVKTTEEDEEKRLKEFGDWLENEGNENK